jgi:hypothetical protein
METTCVVLKTSYRYNDLPGICIIQQHTTKCCL